MRITTKIEYVWSEKQNRYLLLSEKWTNWFGPVAFAKGASAQQTDLANSQQQFYNTMTNDYNQQFANQNAILGTLQKSLNPIIAGGPNQFGFSEGQTNSLNSSAIQNTGQQYANAAKAANENMAAAGGGNSYLPSGVQAQQKSQLASTAANQASNQLLGIQQAGWNQGYNTYESAIGQLGSVASQYNPTGYSGAATGAGTAAGNSWNQIQQENQAANPFNAILGAAGGAASSYLGTL